MDTHIRCGAVFASLAAILLSTARVDAAGLEVGHSAPSVEAFDQQGRLWRMSQQSGYVVVYFYPGDFEKGCIEQAMGFRDHLEEFSKLGATVVGVSGDQIPTHHLFRQLFGLNFTLLSDETGAVADQFGVDFRPRGKARVFQPNGRPFYIKDSRNSMIVRRGMTADRWTFVIDPQGTIVDAQSNVDPATETKRVLDLLTRLQSGLPPQ